MANLIQHKRSNTSGVIPTANGLSYGELAINYADAKLYTKRNDNSIINLPVTSISGTYITPASGSFNTVIFNNVENENLTQGQIAWNNTYGTVELGLESDHKLHIGQETNFRIRNNSGSTLYKGQAVYATGIHNDNIRLLVNKYVADGSIREVRFIGLISETIDDTESGLTTNFGYIRGNESIPLDTRGNVIGNIATGDETWLQGDILYVHPTIPGKLTKVEPKHSISVALVVRVHQTEGVLLVRPSSYGHLDDLHDVNISGVTNNQYLRYDIASDTWLPTSSGIFNNVYASGNVGIGAITPTTKLDVSGVITANSGNSTNWNTAYGWGNHASAGYQSASTALTTSTSFGGDVSGTYNNIVISDDSHNHIIGNIDGLQTALDGKVAKSGDTMTGALTLSGDPSSSLHAATKQYVDNILAANNAMIFKGSIGSGGISSLPTSFEAGWAYVVTTQGTYANQVCEQGDLIIATVDRASGGTDADWIVVQTNTDGAVIGPASATNGNFPVFNGTTGKLIANSTYGPSSFAAASHNQAIATISDSTTVGQNLVKLTNPSAIRFLRINSDNTVSALSDSDFRTAIGAGTSSTTGTVTSVVGTGTVAGLTLSGTVTSTGNLILGGSLSSATSSANGGIKLGSDTVQSVAANSVTATSSRTYAVQLNSTGQAVVNVPWVDTDTNTTYTAGTGLTLTGTSFSVNYGTTSITACVGNDSRLSDARTPTAHALSSHTATAWRMFYSNATTTAIQELAFGNAGTYLRSGGASANPTWATIAYSEISGTPTIPTVNDATLTMNVSGTGLSGSQTFSANQSSNATFTVTSNATSANTGSTIVARDASGNFSAGTISGAFSASADQGIVNQQNGNTAIWRARILSKNSTADKASFLGTYGSIAGVFAHNNALNAWADLYVNTVDGSAGGIVRMPTGVLIGGNTAWHAGNDGAGSTLDADLLDGNHASAFYLATNPNGYTSNAGTVTSVAALTLGTTGTDVSSTVANGTTTPVITLNIPTASASNRGALSSTDWSTFNNKAAANQTMYIGTTAVTINRASASLSLTGVSIDGNAGTVTNGVYSSSVTVNGNIPVWTATSKNLGAGYAVSTSLSTQNSSTYIPRADAVKSYVDTSLSSYQPLLTNPVTGTGTTNYISKWTSSSAQGNSIIFDNGTNVGVGTSSPGVLLDVRGTAIITNSAGNNYNENLRLPESSNGYVAIHMGGSASSTSGTGSNQWAIVKNNSSGSHRFDIRHSNTEIITALTGGNVGIGTTTPGEKLTIKGTVRSEATSNTNYVQFYHSGSEGVIETNSGSFSFGAGNGIVYLFKSGINSQFRVYGSSGSSNYLTLSHDNNDGSITTAVGDLVLNSATGKVGVGTSTPTYTLQVNGSFGATTKSFRIDHPSRPNYTLEYGSLESPYHGVRLTGRAKVVKGVCVVDLPPYLKDLIHDDENINIQLTNLKHGKTLYVSNIDLNNSQFVVKCERAKTLPDLEFFWTFSGVRKDVENLVVEKPKEV